MKVTPAKEKILKKIREALSNPTPLPFPSSEGTSSVYVKSNEEPAVLFAQEFTKLQGKFVYCANKQDFFSSLNQIINSQNWNEMFCNEENLIQLLSEDNNIKFTQKSLPDCDASFTTCECLVARTGSILLSSAQQSGRTVSVYAPVHVCIAFSKQLVYDIKDALQLMQEKYAGKIPSFITLATGPSRTADIEKTLVVGVHGPKEVFVFFIDE